MSKKQEKDGLEVILGFEVIKNANKNSNISYYLRANRVYGLLRFPGNPDILYATNSRGKACKVNGCCCFTDKDGHLAAIDISPKEKKELMRSSRKK
jgi:hypothetical protein